MKNSKEILKKANIIPRLRLAIKITKEDGKDGGTKGTGPHRVKFLLDKEVVGVDSQTGKERPEIAYLVEENGEKKSYRVSKFDKKGEIHYLVQRLAEVEEGEEVILEFKRKGLKGFIEVTRLNSHVKEISDDDIPVINEDEQTDSESDFPVEGEVKE